MTRKMFAALRSPADRFVAPGGTTDPARAGRVRTLALASSLCLLAAGCGGSGGDSTGGGGTPDPGGGGGPVTAPSNLAYSGGSLFLVLGAPLPPIAPTLQGVATSFSITPALPAGVTLDPVSGILAGTPTDRGPRKRYHVTAANSIGQTTGAVEIEVAGPTRFAYVANSGDDTLSIYAIDADSGRLHFHGFHAQPAGQAGPGPLVVHPDGLVAYVANEDSNSLSAHRLDTATGRITSTAVHALGAGPHSLELLDSASFLYVASESAGSIACFAVDAQDGSLVSTGAPLATGSAPSQLVADPLGRYLVALNESASTVTSYSVNATTGALTSAGTWSLGVGTMAGAAVAPSGRALYVTLQGSDRILHFSVDPDTGLLQEGASLPTGGDPAPPTIHPTGKRVYVPDVVAGSLSRYSVDASTGALTAEGNTIATTGADHVAFDDVGEYAYSVNEGDNSLMTFRYDAQSGEIIELEARRTRQAPVGLGFAAGNDAIDVRASHMYVANHGSDSIFAFAVDATSGQLAAPAIAPTGDGPIDVALDPLGRYAFTITDTTRLLQSYVVQPNGSLNAVGSPFVLTGVPTSVAVDPSGRFAFVTDVSANQVLRFAIAAQPTPGPILSFLDARPVGAYPNAVAVDPTGQMVYVVNRLGGGAGNGSISQFSMHPLTGALTAHADALATAHPTSIAFSPSGERACSTFSSGHLVFAYDIDPHTGLLTPVTPGTRALPLPFDVEVSASGRFCYTVMYDPTQPTAPSGLLVFDVREADGALWNEDTGSLEPTSFVLTGLHPVDIASTPDERFVYVVNEASFSVTALAIDPQDGHLTTVQDILTAVSPRSIDMALRID